MQRLAMSYVIHHVHSPFTVSAQGSAEPAEDSSTQSGSCNSQCINLAFLQMHRTRRFIVRFKCQNLLNSLLQRPQCKTVWWFTKRKQTRTVTSNINVKTSAIGNDFFSLVTFLSITFKKKEKRNSISIYTLQLFGPLAEWLRGSDVCKLSKCAIFVWQALPLNPHWIGAIKTTWLMAEHGGEWVAFSFRKEKNRKCSHDCFTSPMGTFLAQGDHSESNTIRRGCRRERALKGIWKLKWRLQIHCCISKTVFSSFFISEQEFQVFQESQAAILNWS